MPNDNAKTIITSLTVREIETLYKKQSLLLKLQNINLTTAKELFNNNVEQIQTKENKKNLRDLEEYTFITKNFQTKIKKLEDKKQDKIIKLLSEIVKVVK